MTRFITTHVGYDTMPRCYSLFINNYYQLGQGNQIHKQFQVNSQKLAYLLVNGELFNN